MCEKNMIERNVILKSVTTLKIGGKARFFCRVKTVEALRDALVFAGQNRLPFVVIGEGSNVLVSDKGFNGLVIRMEIGGVEFESQKGGAEYRAAAGAGVRWDDLVKASVEKKLFGLENLSGIPGTVGAAPVQNIGAYGAEIKDTLHSVEALDCETFKMRTFTNAECGFGYRDSFFKTPEGKKYIITRVSFLLRANGTPNISYKDLQEKITNHQSPIINGQQKITPHDVRRMVLEIRKRKFPDLKKFGTAGSFFKNPIVPAAEFALLKKKFPDLPGFSHPSLDKEGVGGGLIKIPLAWILDKLCGVKGLRIGRVGLFENQPLVLVNHGNATAAEVRSLAEKIAGLVLKKTGIKIEWEVQQI